MFDKMTSLASKICSTLSPRRRRKKKIFPLESAMIHNLKKACFHISQFTEKSKFTEKENIYLHRCSVGKYMKGAEICLKAMKCNKYKFSKFTVDNYDMSIRYIYYILTARLENKEKSKLASKYLKALKRKY
tara:strand:+ start:351 stop:743 length:393 start_codon:yes stop_codon:yes gene_type:complete